MTPASPAPLVLRGELTRAGDGGVGALVAEGALAYLVRGDALDVIDLGDPARPRLRARHQLAGDGFRLAVDAGRVAAVSGDAVELIDVRDPDTPRRAGVVDVGAPAGINDVALAGDVLWSTDGDALVAHQVRWDGGAAARLGRCPLAMAGRITLAGDRAFVAADFEGMYVVDAADPRRPSRLGNFRGPGDVTRVAIDGGHAYVADYTGGVSVVDVSAPRRPRARAEWDHGIVGDVLARGGRAYLAMGPLVVLDVSAPDRPVAAGNLSLRDGDTAWALAWAGELVLALGEGGLSVWSRP